MNIFMLFLISSSIQYTLVSNFDASNNPDITNWTCFSCIFGYTTCDSKQILGGYQRVYNNKWIAIVNGDLNPHFKIKVEILIAKLGDWNGNGFQILNDEKLQFTTLCSSSLSSIYCDSVQYDEESIIFDIPHHKRSLILSIKMDTQVTSIYWGIRKYNLYIKECPLGCEYCKDGDFTCKFKLLVTSLNDIILINNDGWQNGGVIRLTQFNTEVNSFYLSNGELTFKTFQLNNHQSIKLQFQYYTDAQSKIQVDSVFLKTLYSTSSRWFFYETDFIPHSQLFLTIYFSPLSSFFQFRDLEVYTSKYVKQYQVNLIIEPECVIYIQDQCLECSLGWDFDAFLEKCVPICGDGLVRGDEQCDSGNNIVSYCVDCQRLCDKYCIICQFGICQQCQSGFQINQNSSVDGECQSICGDSIVVSDFESCDDGNSLPYDGCYNCQYQCSLDCIICQNGVCQMACGVGYIYENGRCQSICGDSLKTSEEECDDGNTLPYDGCYNCLYQCIEGCNICEFGICTLKCGENYQFVNGQCKSICGDSIITIDEECDDGNLLPYDGCYNCQYQCSLDCIICQNGVCQLACGVGYLNDNGQCKSICGDSLKTIDEECDDGNPLPYDGCYNCQYQCIEGCNICEFGICLLKCGEGYLFVNGECQSYCGDSIKTMDEECDDGNDDDNDGCFNCQFQCIKDCNICQNGKCLLKCDEGQIFKNNQCYGICGDGIKTKDEQCDDGNNEPYDGCFDCKYQCPKQCIDCFFDVCIQCEQFYEVDNNICMPIVNCGNGKLDYQEQCDDYNNEANDGCFKCQIETNWNCKQYDINLPSECQFLKQVDVYLTYLNITGNKQYVELSFSDKVKVLKYSNLSQTLNFSVIDVPQEKQIVNLIVQSEVLKQASKGLYLFEIEINDILSQMPYLQIEFGQTVYNSENLEITKVPTKMKLRLPNYLNQAQKQLAQNLVALNTIAIYSIAAFALLSLLFGVLDPILEIISILSYQQYLRYINIQYPLNLLIYFSINDLIDLTPLLDFFRLDFIIPITFLQSYQKFKEYQLNGDLIANLQAQMVEIIINLMLALFLSKSITKLFLYKCIFTSKFFYYASLLAKYLKSQIVFKVCSGLLKAVKLILQIKKMLSMEGINQLLYINGWDLIFKAFLYLYSLSNEQEFGLRSYISIVLSFLIIFLYVKLTLSFLTNNKTNGNHTQDVKKKKNDKLFGISLLRQILFLFIIVFFQDQSNLQVIGISFINIFWTIAILRFRKTYSKISFYTNFIIEISIAIFTLTSMIYLQDFSSFISVNFGILCGWINIVLLSLGIQFYLIFSIFQVIMKYIEKKRAQQIKQQKRRRNLLQIFSI